MVYRLQPLNDPRWGGFLQRHAQSSVFHSVQWLDALRRTYGYEPIAVTTCPPDAALDNALVFCQIRSWLTGRRLVSLPFSDHCDPLVNEGADLSAMIPALTKDLRRDKVRYLEIRPTQPVDLVGHGLQPAESFCWHRIDLKPSLDQLFRNFHKDSIQRKIRRAEREGLTLMEGESVDKLDSFYRLLLLTRRRHLLPPQPKKWFRSLIGNFGAALRIRVACKDGQPVASILTLDHKDVLTYKYGCSDSRFHQLGGMHLLFWTSIQEAKQAGMSLFDLGRSDTDDQGLITFKNRWGAECSLLTYLRWSTRKLPQTDGQSPKHSEPGAVRTLLQYLPDPVLRAAGNLLYKHAG